MAKELDNNRDVVRLALGRIFRMASRPVAPGDIAEYERCRALVLDNAPEAPPSYAPNYARDYKSRAQGD